MEVVRRAANGLAMVVWGFIAFLGSKYLGLDFGEQGVLFQTALATVLTTIFVAAVDMAAKKVPWLGFLLLSPVQPMFLNSDERRMIARGIPQEVSTSTGPVQASISRKLKQFGAKAW